MMTKNAQISSAVLAATSVPLPVLSGTTSGTVSDADSHKGQHELSVDYCCNIPCAPSTPKSPEMMTKKSQNDFAADEVLTATNVPLPVFSSAGALSQQVEDPESDLDLSDMEGLDELEKDFEQAEAEQAEQAEELSDDEAAARIQGAWRRFFQHKFAWVVEGFRFAPMSTLNRVLVRGVGNPKAHFFELAPDARVRLDGYCIKWGTRTKYSKRLGTALRWTSHTKHAEQLERIWQDVILAPEPEEPEEPEAPVAPVAPQAPMDLEACDQLIDSRGDFEKELGTAKRTAKRKHNVLNTFTEETRKRLKSMPQEMRESYIELIQAELQPKSKRYTSSYFASCMRSKVDKFTSNTYTRRIVNPKRTKRQLAKDLKSVDTTIQEINRLDKQRCAAYYKEQQGMHKNTKLDAAQIEMAEAPHTTLKEKVQVYKQHMKAYEDMQAKMAMFLGNIATSAEDIVLWVQQNNI